VTSNADSESATPEMFTVRHGIQGLFHVSHR